MDIETTLDGNSLTYNNRKNKDNSSNDFELRMGIRSWRPDWLQKFNNIKWFILILSLASTTQGNYNFFGEHCNYNLEH